MVLLVVVVLLAVAASALASQSPIDIRSRGTLAVRKPPMVYKDYGRKYDNFLENTGHGCQITVRHPVHRPRLRGGPLSAEHVFEQAHFHWGPSNKQGSEHHLNGEAYSMEAHLVHYNSKYKDYAEAASKPDGLAVVAFFLECADCDMSPARRHRLLCSARREGSRRGNREAPWLLAALCKASSEAWARAGAMLDRYLSPAVGQRLRNRLFPSGPGGYKNHQFQAVVDAVPRVRRAGSAKAAVKASLLAWAVPALEESGYYTYDGSLTTAPFSENVVWIVYRGIIPVGKAQIEPFRSIENKDSLALRNNYRVLQDNSDVSLWWVP